MIWRFWLSDKTVRKFEELPIYCQRQNCSPGILVSSKVWFIVTRWFLENGLLLNPDKTEAVLFGTLVQRKKIPTAGGIDVTGAVVPFSDTVKLLGVTLDSALSMDRHVTEVVRSCSYHTRALRHIHTWRRQVSRSQHRCVSTRLRKRTAARYIDQQHPQAAGCSELFGQSGVSGPALCQCHRVTSTAPQASSPAKIQLQACHHHIQDQLNQDSGLPVWHHSRMPSYTHSAICW